MIWTVARLGAVLGAGLIALGVAVSLVGSLKFADLQRRAGVLLSLRPEDWRRARTLGDTPQWRGAARWSAAASVLIVAGAVLASPFALLKILDGVQ